MRALLLILGAMIALPGVSAAQLPGLRPGQRVRITSADLAPPVATGVIGAVDADSVLLLRGVGTGDTLRTSVPMSGITRLEISRGTHSKWQTGLVIGAATGALTGAIIGASSGDSFVLTREASAFLGALVFTPIGGTIGVVAGALTKQEDWEAVPLRRPGIAVQFRTGAGLRVTIGL